MAEAPLADSAPTRLPGQPGTLPLADQLGHGYRERRRRQDVDPRQPAGAAAAEPADGQSDRRETHPGVFSIGRLNLILMTSALLLSLMSDATSSYW